MSYAIPLSRSHIKPDDVAELARLLRSKFGDKDAEANKWLEADLWDLRAKPIDLIRRDEFGVLRVISYLKDQVA